MSKRLTQRVRQLEEILPCSCNKEINRYYEPSPMTGHRPGCEIHKQTIQWLLSTKEERNIREGDTDGY